MKKYIYLLPFLFIFFIYACKKDKQKQSGSNLHSFKVNVVGADFSQQIAGFNGNSTRRTDAVVTDPSLFKNYIDTLVIRTPLRVDKYDKNTFSSINNISGLLAPGKYYISAMGYQHNGHGDDRYIYYGDDDNDRVTNTWYDTYAGQASFTIADSDVTVNLQLHRVNADLEVIIKDKIPAVVNTITLELSADYWGYSPGVVNGFNNGAPYTLFTNHLSYIIPSTAIGTANYTMDVLSVNTTTPFTLTIAAYDIKGNMIATRIINNVSLTANQKSIYTGILFGGITNEGGYHAVADTTWGATTIKSF